MAKAKPFLLMELPDYTYPLNLACPTCYRPLDSLKRRDGRCNTCRNSKDVLPINFVRRTKRKRDEDEENDRKVSKRYNRDND